MQRFLDEVGPVGLGLDDGSDEEIDDGADPWALGHDEDDGDRFGPWEGDDDLTDGWLDEQLARLDDADPGGAHDAGDGTTASEPADDGVVLRRPAPRRARRRRAEQEVVADLPAPNVPGYRRDRRGTWRYTATGAAVPGARDLTLRSLHRFPATGGHVAVPVDLVRREPELTWCLAWKHTLTTRLTGGRSVTVVRVPTAEWERRADIPLGLWAPELTASRLLGIADVARLAGVSPATITAYLSRRRMPEPVLRLGHAPVWSRPVIRHWLASRPGQGRRTAGSGRPTPS